MRPIVIFSFFFLFVSLSVKANHGCRLSNGSIHSPQTGAALLGASLNPPSLGLLIPYYNSPRVNTAFGSCPTYAGNIMTTGRKCTTSALNVLGLGLVAQNEGDEVTFNLIECDLDSFGWILGLVCGSVTFLYIKKDDN
ncbi:MAG: hypothetical protein EOO90_26970 [Pedobacter sp.]|nr:MAG: hypothetical protein EOO90_26970 [Pedobacter sp.]